MMEFLRLAAEVLHDAGYATGSIPTVALDALTFENSTVLGFLVRYDTVEQLRSSWQQDADMILSAQRFALHKAGEKAWNLYAVFVCEETPSDTDSQIASLIEEDLVGFRKIVRAGTVDSLDIKEALLPLLPFQSAPKLDAVDMEVEIRQRTTELPERAVTGFMTGTEDNLLLQILEEGP